MSEPTASPTTWQALEHVRDAIKLVQVARGFYTDIGQGVIALEPKQVPEDDGVEFTMVLGLPADVDDTGTSRSTVASDMDAIIETAIPFADDAMSRAHRVRNDLMRALIPLRKSRRELPSCIRDFKVSGTTIALPDDGSAFVIVQVRARVGLIELTTPAT